MEEELAIIREQKKIANKARTEDVAILRQTLEPIQEALGELKETIEESISLEKKEKPQQEYYDKDFNAKLLTTISKALTLIGNFKIPEQKQIDLTPIAAEIKKQNESIIALLNKPNQSEELQRLIVAMVGKQTSFLEREFKEVDYSEQLKKISESISNKTSDRVEKLTVVYEYGGSIKEVVPVYKK